jgi:hypothetical protein
MGSDIGERSLNCDLGTAVRLYCQELKPVVKFRN